MLKINATFFKSKNVLKITHLKIIFVSSFRKLFLMYCTTRGGEKNCLCLVFNYDDNYSPLYYKIIRHRRLRWDGRFTRCNKVEITIVIIHIIIWGPCHTQKNSNTLLALLFWIIYTFYGFLTLNHVS